MPALFYLSSITIHIKAWINAYFLLWQNNNPLYGYIEFVYSTHNSVCFHLLFLVNCAAMNSDVWMSIQHLFLILWGSISRNENVTTWNPMWGIENYSLQKLHIPLSYTQKFQLSHSMIASFLFFYDGLLNDYIVISLCSFYLIYLIINDIENLLICFLAIFFEEMSLEVLCPLLSWVIYLHIPVRYLIHKCFLSLSWLGFQLLDISFDM